MEKSYIFERIVLIARGLGWDEHRLTEWNDKLSKSIKENNSEAIDICNKMIISINTEIDGYESELDKLKHALQDNQLQQMLFIDYLL